jgi:hypothetical protein
LRTSRRLLFSLTIGVCIQNHTVRHCEPGSVNLPYSTAKIRAVVSEAFPLKVLASASDALAGWHTRGKLVVVP